ncbi:MAG: hypothetical protein LQ351_006491 [Letrouitia transgressa]|nr:MAG: hypothetical protein LQ351_006491 [Letrouitia transgressa]
MPAAAASGADATANGNAKSRDHNQGNQDKKYTIEQKAAVIRVRRCSATAFYEILGVEKTVSDAEIKKAYRKLSLLTHPDKNGYEGADEAFKMVSRAFQILSDPDKKTKYDKFGGDPDNRFGPGSTSSASPFSGFARSPGGRGPMFEDEISPEELFNRFFGGGGMGGGPFGGGMFDGPQFVFNVGGGPGIRVHQFGGGRPRRRPRDANGNNEEPPQSAMSVLTNLLPILILFVLPLLSSIFSSPTPSGPSFRFNSPEPPYVMHRTTPRLKVDYYLNPDEVADYNGRKMSELDRKAENSYITGLQYDCQLEMQTRNRMMEDAQGWFIQDAEKMRQARNYDMKNWYGGSSLNMSDSLSEADKIRNKRLAKLGSQASAQSSISGEGRGDGSTASPQPKAPLQPGANPEQSAPKINITNLAENYNPKETSLTQLETRRNKEDAPRINPDNTNDSPMTPTKRPNSVNRRPASRAGETLEEWENRVLSGIFRVSVDPSVKSDVHGHTLYFAKGVREELEEQGGPIRLSTNVLEQAIVEVGSDSGKAKPLDYLLGCWKRVSRQLRSYRGQKIDEAKVDIVKEARRLCMSYCIFAVTIPDMFGQEPSATSPLTPHLLVDPEDDRGLCHDFLTEAISRFPEDDGVQPALIGAIEDMSRQLAKMTMNNDDYKLYVGALRNLVRYPALVKAIAQSPLFLPPSASAADLEATTLLGPFFAISPLQREATMNYFSSPKTRDQSFIETTQRTLRMALSAHQQDLLDIVNHIIKADKESRERMLDWFALCVNKNHKRRAMQVDQKLVSSDGFMINLTICLDQLCEPFMDAQFTKIDRIDVDYLRRNPRVDIKEETKLNADQSTSDEFFSQPADGQSNFISEVFFLTLAAHHYGSEAASNKMSQLEKDLKRMEKHIEEIELDRHKFIDDPLRLRMFENAVQKYKDQIDKGLSYKHAVQGVLLDEQNQQRTMQFMRYVIVWLFRLVTPTSQYPKEPLRLPLPLEQPEVFKCLPEYFLENVVGAYRFVMQNMPLNIFSTQSDELVMLCITFLRSSEYIKNPYLKAGLVTIMYHGIWPFRNRSKGVLGDLLTSLDIATEHLLHALMKFYIEVENTGAHTQFYDKFNIRFEIFQIIKCIWSNTMYREQLDRESKVNVDFFVRFVNLLLNDVTFVLDESLSAFQQIHNLSNELKTSNGMEQAIRTEKEEALSAAQGKAKSYMQLTNETVAMLKLFTEALADSFTMPEIVQRLADMLDYNLNVLVGPKRKDLVVENPKEYGFQPGVLLGEIVDVYLNLGRKESFVLAVARDGRSYKPANFEEARRILATKLFRSTREVDAWVSLFQKFKKAKEADDQAEEDLGDIPDEFLDPLVFTLMEDPVILPTSKTSIDRSTIRSHLLSDPNDPFNRSPLKIEDVIPDTELKERIEAFKAEKRGAKTLAAAETNSMDISPG